MSKQLTGRQRAYVKKHSKYHELDPSEADSELNIIPFLDIVMNLIMFLLMTVSTVAFFSQVEATLPQYSSGRAGTRSTANENALNLMVTITESGIIVTGSSGKLAPGCESTMSGRVITVPRAGEGYDWRALTACAEKIKETFADEHRVTVGADPTIHYEHVIHAMDAMRTNASGVELFPEVLLSAGVR
ncbi:MAG: biopolymer transporter ExbD [Sandaracinaceae bacterium]|nr:biopolymer transporter ExbD [Sandaracinaceae bacterium]